MFPKSFVPVKPFEDFKWRWASLECTEGINDPVILLGVLFRMRKLEGRGLRFSSDEFAKELMELTEDTKDSVGGIGLSRRTGPRNIMRNSQQYWKAVGLIPDNTKGLIRLTEFGRRVADHDISQTEFSAVTVQTLRLPNPHIQTPDECRRWESHGLLIYPLRILLSIVMELDRLGQGYITTEELARIVIPLSGCHAEIADYVNFILMWREGGLSLDKWPNCCEKRNDLRIAREFLLFLANYGYLERAEGATREVERYSLNSLIAGEIAEMLSVPVAEREEVLGRIRSNDIASEVERKRVGYHSVGRPGQNRFRREVLAACGRCVITNVKMPEVLEAAHIKPYKYKGESTVANGLAMRTDIHILFDSGHLRISETGEVDLSTAARMDYGASIPPRIAIPPFTNRDFLRWRWENYNGV